MRGACRFADKCTPLWVRRSGWCWRLRDFTDSVEQIFRTGIAEGQFRADAEPGQFQHDLTGIMLAFFHAYRLLAEAEADARARTAFERLLLANRASHDS